MNKYLAFFAYLAVLPVSGQTTSGTTPSITFQNEDKGTLYPPLNEREKQDYYSNKNDDVFQIPADQALDGCTYAAGYSYPLRCYDNGSLVFDDSNPKLRTQAVLDRLAVAQGKTGQYNKLIVDSPVRTNNATADDDQ